MRAVMLGDNGDVIEAGASEILFSLDVFEDDADRELTTFTGEFQRLFGGTECFAGMFQLLLERYHSRMRFHDLPGNFLVELLAFDDDSALS